MRGLLRLWLVLSALWAAFFIYWTGSYEAAIVPPLFVLLLGRALVWAFEPRWFTVRRGGHSGRRHLHPAEPFKVVRQIPRRDCQPRHVGRTRLRVGRMKCERPFRD